MPSATVFGFSKRQLKMLEVIILLNAMALSLVLPSVTSTGEIPSTSCLSQSSLTTPFSSSPCGMIKNTNFVTTSHTQTFTDSTTSFVMNARNKDLLTIGAFADFGIPANDTTVGIVDSFGTSFVQQKAFSYNYSASTHILTMSIWTGFVTIPNLPNSITTGPDTITITWIGVGATTRIVAASWANVLGIGNTVNATSGLGTSTIENTNMTLNYNNDVIASIGGWNPNVGCGAESALIGSTFLGSTCNAFEPFNADMGFRGPLNPQGQTIQHGFTLSVSAQWAMLSIELIPTVEDVHIQPFIAAHGTLAVTKNSGIQNKYQLYFLSQCCNGPPAVPGDRLFCQATLNIRGNDTLNDHAVNIALNDTTNNALVSVAQITILAHTSPNPLFAVTLSGSILMATASDSIALEINFLTSTNFQITMIGSVFGPRINCVDISL